MRPRQGLGNLQLRILSAVVLAAVVLALTYLGGLSSRLLAAALGALVFYEWATIAGLSRDRPLHALMAGFLAAALGALVLGAQAAVVLLFLAGGVVSGTLMGVARGSGVTGAAGLAYAGLPAVAFAYLRGDDQAGLVAVLVLFATVWATDIFAYFAGRALGGPKLAPSISPGKTWSGAVGGAVAGVAAGLAAAALGGITPSFWLVLLVLSLSVVSQAGDLFESAFKRRHGVKDSGTLIPGHGGVMDRVDGLVAAAFLLFVVGAAASGLDTPSAAIFGS